MMGTCCGKPAAPLAARLVNGDSGAGSQGSVGELAGGISMDLEAQLAAKDAVITAQASQLAALSTQLAEQVRRVAALEAAARARAGAAHATAVAVRRAAAPAEVRAVLAPTFASSVVGTPEHERVAPVVADWLVGAHAAAHDDPATKCLARLVLGVQPFAANMEWAEIWEGYKEGLRRVLQALGTPLGAAFVREGLQAVLGSLTLAPHRLVAVDQTRCAAAGQPHALRCDIEGVVPLPAAWDFAEPAARQRHERVSAHLLVMLAQALNSAFHEMMRAVLGPHVVAGEGVMARAKDGHWRLTPEKGVARMEGKRITDHAPAAGCRTMLNVDVLRVIGVCKTADQLRAAVAALGARFEGCGRVKNGFAVADASPFFNLRALMTNFIVDFGCTFAQLAAQPGVAALWEDHAERSAPQGSAPRGRWRTEAREALAVLTGAEFAGKKVLFICEAQMLLDDVYQVRKSMHEPYKGYRADTSALLHADMVGETHKVARMAQWTADGETALAAACRDGDTAAAARLLLAAPDAERDTAFVVACAHGRGALLQAVPALARGSAARAWAAAWRRSATAEAALELGAPVLEALLGGAVKVAGGTQHRDAEGLCALDRAASGGHELAVRRLLAAGAGVDSAGGVTPLSRAARGGHGACVARLLAAGAAVDQSDDDGITPLYNAARNGHEAVLAQLLTAGAVVDQADSKGNTALFIAAQKGHEVTVHRLLDAGAAVDRANDSMQSTPLGMACADGHASVVKLLIAAGADPAHVDGAGDTPLSEATANEHDEVVLLLRAAGAVSSDDAE